MGNCTPLPQFFLRQPPSTSQQLSSARNSPLQEVGSSVQPEILLVSQKFSSTRSRQLCSARNSALQKSQQLNSATNQLEKQNSFLTNCECCLLWPVCLIIVFLFLFQVCSPLPAALTAASCTVYSTPYTPAAAASTATSSFCSPKPCSHLPAANSNSLAANSLGANSPASAAADPVTSFTATKRKLFA